MTTATVIATSRPGLEALSVLLDAARPATTRGLDIDTLVERAMSASLPSRGGAPAALDAVTDAARTYASHFFATDTDPAEDLVDSRWMRFWLDERLMVAADVDLDVLRDLAGSPA